MITIQTKILMLAMAFIFLPSATPGAATVPVIDEQALFTSSVAQDAFILLDLSNSMNDSLDASTRLAIAKGSVFSILDDNHDGTINSSDEGSLGLRIGYIRFRNCLSDETDGNYTTGCIQIPGSSSTSRRYLSSKYSLIYCNSKTSCTVSSTGSDCVAGEIASGGTPLASALNEAKIYLDSNKLEDSAASCRKKFVILITDGEDTLSCGGTSADVSGCQAHQYMRRRASVEKAKALANAGYRVFVIGLGVGAGTPEYIKNTLNWMAYSGKTDNPDEANTGATAAYTPPATSCAEDSGAITATCYDSSHPYPGGGISTNNFQGSSNDPGYLPLSGYAFFAANANQLNAAMRTIMNIIRETIYFFSQASIQSSRTEDENFLYESSFDPDDSDPFWCGHLKKYPIDSSGNVGEMVVNGDAGEMLKSKPSYVDRKMKTYTGGSMVDFTDANMTPALIDVTTTAEVNAIVGYFRGNPAYNPDVCKLGDLFPSSPITVGTPSAFFDDVLDEGNAFATHRANHTRTSSNGNRLIVAGANDGQLHAFRTRDMSEAWSFIPPNLLSKLKNVAHKSHPTLLTHQYFVNGAVTVADVWLGTGDGAGKSASDWKTILVLGEGRGSTERLWSSSGSCDSGLVGIYDAGHPYYCGYFALNITDTLNPSYLWHITPSSSQAPYFSESWSKMAIGRVRIDGKEKWVGFIGGGYNGGDCVGGGACDKRGKGFFVIDLADGSVLWSYTMANNANLQYSIPAQPAIVDTDNDGFIDLAYLGDLGGNMWRFNFCRASNTSCGVSDWSGGFLFDSPSGAIRPIHTCAAVARDTSGRLWVYWGTGDKVDPTNPSAQEHFYSVIDSDLTSPIDFSNVETLFTDASEWNSATKTAGCRIQLSGGEKVLADPTVFGGIVYFTTFKPSNSVDPCDQAGNASLYAIKYTKGSGVLSNGTETGTTKSITIGKGIPSAPVISLNPRSGGGSPDLFVTISRGGGIGGNTFRVNMDPPGVANRSNMLYWLDRRLQ